MGVTAFIGAGAVLDIGGPRTDFLTAAVKRRQQWDGIPNSHVTVPAIQQIADALDQYFRPASANFEDIFHAVESLISLVAGLDARTAKPFKPAIGAFVTPNAGTNINPLILSQASDHIIDEVANHIVRYVNGLEPRGAHQWFSQFWQAANRRCSWDIATLNYDNCIEQSLGAGLWEDGFAPIEPGIFRFDPARVVTCTTTRMLHLHGSVFYGYPRFRDPNRFKFKDDHEDLYRFDSHDEAKRCWFGRSRNQAQSGERATAGPIITGQRKPDKLLSLPYSTYEAVLHDALLKNSSLLIAGYSFGDLHFNHLLSRTTRLHGDRRRIVVVDWVPSNLRADYWIPNAWPTFEIGRHLATLSHGTLPVDGRYATPWVSRDGRCRVYLEGFHDTIRDHGADTSSATCQTPWHLRTTARRSWKCLRVRLNARVKT